MKNSSILVPLFRTIDKVLFGIEEINEIEKQPDLIVSENEERFDIEETKN